MALLNCPECGHAVSTHATACPECGYPLPEVVTPDIIPESTVGTAPVLTKTAKRKILIVIGALVAIAIICIIIFAFVRSSSRATIIPYNLSWGDPYSKLKNANSETTEIKKNDAGNYLCSCNLTPSYIGLDDEAISIGASWNFKDGETLQSVLIVLTPESSCSMTTEQIYNYTAEHFSELFQMQPESKYSFEKVWKNDSTSAEVCYWSDKFLTISIEAIS